MGAVAVQPAWMHVVGSSSPFHLLNAAALILYAVCSSMCEPGLSLWMSDQSTDITALPIPCASSSHLAARA